MWSYLNKDFDLHFDVETLWGLWLYFKLGMVWLHSFYVPPTSILSLFYLSCGPWLLFISMLLSKFVNATILNIELNSNMAIGFHIAGYV